MDKGLTSNLRKLALLLLLSANLFLPGRGQAQVGDANPPPQPVKLIFIHHSTGENWLADDYGRLGQALAANNYYVSDTNYGWGPDAIGDRTDIPNWVEWFRSEQTPVYMEALFNESEQHASYSRSFGDPGGENRIVLFKSCFPNSELEGHPGDGPDPDGWLSVGHAKWVYNEILRYFATRPDKLFVVITAPPLSDDTYASNARAFNNWLLNDWLSENNYSYTNVVVFDFFNELTSPQARHSAVDGQVVYIAGNRNTLYYPSEDDHPSPSGSQKATADFVPLLNFYYQRWIASAPSTGASNPPVPPATQAEPPAVPALVSGLGEIDNFESSCRLSSDGWRAYFDETSETRIVCAPTTETACNGARSLQVDFDVPAAGWATCALSFDDAQDWRGAQGVSFNLHAEQGGLHFNVDIYAGDRDNPGTYVYTVETPPESAAGWVQVTLRWDDFRRIEWEENAGMPLQDPAAIHGIEIGISALEDAPSTGRLWIDDLTLTSGETAETLVEIPPVVTQPAPPISDEADQPKVDAPERSGPCTSAFVLPLLAIAFFGMARKPRASKR